MNEYSAENGLPVPDRLDSMQSTKTLFSERTGHDDPDWLRAWPFGPVHYSQDWSCRLDGRFDTVCGKSPYYWPESYWPEHEVCAECKAWVEEHGTAAPMLYQTRPIPPAEAEPLERDPVDMADACLATWSTPGELQLRHERGDHDRCPVTWCEVAAIYAQADESCKRPRESSEGGFDA